MSDSDEIRNSVTKIIKNVAPNIEAIRKVEWHPEDGLLKLVLLTVIVRQFECMSVAISPETEKFLHFLVPFVRTACEELIWAKYLVSLDREDAEVLVRCLSAKDLFDSLRAQQAYAPESIKILGLANHLVTASRRQVQVTQDLTALAGRLKWNLRSGAKVPSVKYMAKKVQLEPLYNLIYSASSRFGHFSPHELMRRVWGKPGEMTISSSNFSDYWATFGIYWGLRIFLDLLISLNDFLCVIPLDDAKDSDLGEAILAAAAKLGEIGAVPVITAEELAWPD
jgi:hypothetical protein